MREEIARDPKKRRRPAAMLVSPTPRKYGASWEG